MLLAVLPFADIDRPAIGVSLLAAALRARGHAVRVEYFNLDLAETIGVGVYRQLADEISPQTLVGEWFFADLVFGDQIPPAHDFVERILGGVAPGVVDKILRAREVRRSYLRQCADTIVARRPAIVGMTTTFHQTCASLALAKLLKKSPSPPVIIFGGANCEGIMGERLVQSFPWVDYACTREGDVLFPNFVDEVLAGAPVTPVPGLTARSMPPYDGAAAPFVDLDALPIPEYDDYFAKIASSPIGLELRPTIVVESARGCWWGAKHHCTFCGLNGAGLAFRSKSPDRVVDEVLALTDRYPGNHVDFVDNILDLRYVKTVFPRLGERKPDLNIFFEVKANLRYDQLTTLHMGGVRRMQPGIESLDNDVLKLMDKGCTALQNIALLRWCDELGITLAWNLIGGFPFEDPKAYEQMARLIPLLVHLPPPISIAPVRLDRFSPLFAEAERFDLQRVRPAHAYYFVYPLDRRDLYDLAYYFDFDYGDGRKPLEYMESATRAVASWWNGKQIGSDRCPVLEARWSGDRIVVRDTRPCAVESIVTLMGTEALVFERCDTPQSVRSIAGALTMTQNGVAEVEAALAGLTARKLVIDIAGQYLTLAVFRDRPRGKGNAAAIERVRHEASAAQPVLSAL